MKVRLCFLFTCLLGCISQPLAYGMTDSAVSPARSIRECATCHPAQAKPHPVTSMAHAMELPAECEILKSHPVLMYRVGTYSYRIERQGEASIYSVSDGEQTISVPIGWAFGLGSAGQTYVYQYEGELYQSRVSYYRALAGLDLTLGAQNAKPTNLVQAAGLLMSDEDKVQCFRCHATDAVDHKKLTLSALIPGVQCERCHGSAENHVKSVKVGDAKGARMNDLRTMTSEQTANFCGQCHRTWDEIAGSGLTGVSNVRFQPYRLISSKCYDADDKRIRCTTCHDPHGEVSRVDASYDAKCQACHAGGKVEARACKVANEGCVTCHMPKVELPGSHFKFTDHYIRVARAHARYPG
jgi:Cytochrome c554 and c-prime